MVAWSISQHIQDEVVPTGQRRLSICPRTPPECAARLKLLTRLRLAIRLRRVGLLRGWRL